MLKQDSTSPTMDFRNLRVFTHTAELGSLSKAAAALGVAQSALSRHIGALEVEFGGRLFHRTGRGVVLTELGYRLLPRAQALLADAEQLAEAARAELSTLRGTVSVGMIPSMSHPLAGQLYAIVRDRHPGIRLRLFEGYSGDIEEWLGSGKIDIGIFNRYRSARRDRDALYSADLQLVMAADDPLLHQPSIRLRAVAGLPLVLPMRPNGMRSMLDEICQRKGIALNVQLEVNSSAAIKDAVLHGALYTMLAPNGIVQERRLELMGGVTIIEPAIRLTTILDATRSRPLTAAAREVLRLLPPLVRDMADAISDAVPRRSAVAHANAV